MIMPEENLSGQGDTKIIDCNSSDSDKPKKPNEIEEIKAEVVEEIKAEVVPELNLISDTGVSGLYELALGHFNKCEYEQMDDCLRRIEEVYKSRGANLPEEIGQLRKQARLHFINNAADYLSRNDVTGMETQLSELETKISGGLDEDTKAKATSLRWEAYIDTLGRPLEKHFEDAIAFCVDRTPSGVPIILDGEISNKLQKLGLKKVREEVQNLVEYIRNTDIESEVDYNSIKGKIWGLREGVYLAAIHHNTQKVSEYLKTGAVKSAEELRDKIAEFAKKMLNLNVEEALQRYQSAK